MKSARAVRNQEIVTEVSDYLLSGEGTRPDTYRMYQKTKQYGFPFGGGWAEQPAEFVRDLEAVQVAVDNVAYIRAINAKQKQQSAPPIAGGRQYG